MFPVAVTCGNTFILKPSEKDPGDSDLLLSCIVYQVLEHFLSWHHDFHNPSKRIRSFSLHLDMLKHYSDVVLMAYDFACIFMWSIWDWGLWDIPEVPILHCRNSVLDAWYWCCQAIYLFGFVDLELLFLYNLLLWLKSSMHTVSKKTINNLWFIFFWWKVSIISQTFFFLLSNVGFPKLLVY